MPTTASSHFDPVILSEANRFACETIRGVEGPLYFSQAAKRRREFWRTTSTHPDFSVLYVELRRHSEGLQPRRISRAAPRGHGAKQKRPATPAGLP